MSKVTLTKEQILARDKSNTSIIVSAGAGSGKTQVLSDRILRIVKEGHPMSSLLVLTFTKAAALEMKERIKHNIENDEEVAHRAGEVDSAYITTFDSYALSIVKKMHYLLKDVNGKTLEKDISIIDNSILALKSKEILDELFEEYYQRKEDTFIDLVKRNSFKSDEPLRRFILNFLNKISNKIDKKEYLDNYATNYLNDNYYESLTKEVENFVFTHLNRSMSLDLDDYISSLKEKDAIKFNNYYDALLNVTNYDDLALLLNNFITKAKGADDSLEQFKNFKDSFKFLKEYFKKYPSLETIKNSFKDSEDIIKLIIKMTQELDERLMKYKASINRYEFVDIAKMAIEALKNDEGELNKLKHSLHEILLDEYQDTSDIQEEFVKLIETNNVYMVGDIKQSIYRFRNANPDIFMEKYESYVRNGVGSQKTKIDLNKNFRSRREVLDGINDLFNPLMTLECGGANYEKEHQLIFGFTPYETNYNFDQDNSLEILEYQLEDKKMAKDVEIFTIIRDIQEKILSGYKVFDKENKISREISYGDIAIIIADSIRFKDLKKALDYYNIPAKIEKEDNIIENSLIFIFANILKLIKKVISSYYDEKFTIEEKKAFFSIGRSFLYELTDDELVNIDLDNQYYNHPIYQKIKDISKDYLIKSNEDIVGLIIEEFDIYSKISLIGDASQNISRIEVINNLAKSYSSIGITSLEFIDNLEKILLNEFKIEINSSKKKSDEVTIITIHKSKGLEYPLVYMPFLNKKFAFKSERNNEKNIPIRYSPNYQLLPAYDYKKLIISPLYDIDIKKSAMETISEKIRLFYVALTRAREKLILIKPFGEATNIDMVRENYQSFNDFLNSVKGMNLKYFKSINVEELMISTDYLYLTKNKILNIPKVDTSLTNIKLNIKAKEVTKVHSSKVTHSLVDYSTNEKLALGNKIHAYLETLDFNKPDYSLVDHRYLKHLQNFLEADFMLNLKNPKFYKEYEFVYEDENKYHGIIDLLIECDDKFLIVDYKLKNIDDEAYDAQLNTYKKYLLSLNTNKNIEMILYSIIDHTYRYVK